MNKENITVQIRHVPAELNKEAKRLALAADVSLNQWYLDLIRFAVDQSFEPNRPVTNNPQGA